MNEPGKSQPAHVPVSWMEQSCQRIMSVTASLSLAGIRAEHADSLTFPCEHSGVIQRVVLSGYAVRSESSLKKEDTHFPTHIHSHQQIIIHRCGGSTFTQIHH